jgi:phage terminase large subunit
MGLDDPEKPKSTVAITGDWVEEATQFTERDFTSIDLSLREMTGHYQQIILTYNPDESEGGWIKKRFFDRVDPQAYIHHSTYKDNPDKHFRDHYRVQLEALDDPFLKQIYHDGEWATLKGQIYTNWKMLPKINFPKGQERIFGLDWGFNNPCTLLSMDIVERSSAGFTTFDIYMTELVYESGIITGDLIELMKGRVDDSEKYKPFYGDSAEPDRIVELCRAGYNCMPGKKGDKRGVKDVIFLLKQMRFYTCPENTNLNHELKNWKWQQTKDGDFLDEPADSFNHLLKAAGYGLYTHLKGRMNIQEENKQEAAQIKPQAPDQYDDNYAEIDILDAAKAVAPGFMAG